MTSLWQRAFVCFSFIPVCKVSSKLIQRPHVPRDFVKHFSIIGPLNTLLNHRIIGEVAEFVLIFAWVIVITRKAEVTVFPDKNPERIPRRYYYPYSYVIFAIHNDHRILYVFLNDPHPSCKSMIVIIFCVLMGQVMDSLAIGLTNLCCRQLLFRIDFCVVKNLLIFSENSYLPSSWKSSWLDDPKILNTINVCLWIFLSQLFQKFCAYRLYWIPHCIFLFLFPSDFLVLFKLRELTLSFYKPIFFMYIF